MGRHMATCTSLHAGGDQASNYPKHCSMKRLPLEGKQDQEHMRILPQSRGEDVRSSPRQALCHTDARCMTAGAWPSVEEPAAALTG